MKGRIAKVSWSCVLVVLAGLMVRAGWVAAGMETGWEVMGAQWKKATVGWVWESKEIGEQKPEEQADFWLAEVERVLKANPGDARLAMGAALVLDSPGGGYEKQYVTKMESRAGGGSQEIDRKAIALVLREFESRCNKRCVELAAKATELEPGNVAWWRLRGLLLSSSLSGPATPRALNWAEVLDECARHDPENALYDYLAAKEYWEASAKIDFSGGLPAKLLVNDRDGFEKGRERFAKGQAKAYVAVGDEGFAATAAFLARTNILRSEHAAIANSRLIAIRRMDPIQLVRNWIRQQTDEKLAAGDMAGATALRAQALHSFQQYSAGLPSIACDSQIVLVTNKWAAVLLAQAAEQAGEGAFSTELEQARAAYREAVVGERVVRRADELIAKEKPRISVPTLQSPVSELLPVVFIQIGPDVIVALLVLGAVAAIVVHRRNATEGVSYREVKGVGLVGNVVGVLVGVAFTVVVLGLAPAEVISREVQAWVLTMLLLGVPVLTVGWLVWRRWSGKRFQFSLRTLLLVMLFVAVMCGVLSITRSTENFAADLPFDLSIAPRGRTGLDARSMGDFLADKGARWMWAVEQWQAYHGQIWMIAIWAGIVGLLVQRRMQWEAKAGGVALERWGPIRKWMADVLVSLRGPALAMGAGLLMLYLVLVPEFLAQRERRFQAEIAFSRDPAKHWASVERVIAEVRADEAVMAELSAGVEGEMARQVADRKE